VSETQWSRANRAAAALDTWMMEAHPESAGYGDEGSDEFRSAVIGLLVDIKHLLFRCSPATLLTDLVEDAVDTWGEDVDKLEAGGPGDE
jgi:hypothetical protein